MSWELLEKQPPLLRPGHVMHFSEKWPDEFADKWFRVAAAQAIPYDVTKLIAVGTTSSSWQDLDFDRPATGDVSETYLSLLPEKASSVYEILMGIQGLPAVFPRYNNKYWLALETTLCNPDPADTRRKFLGGWRQVDSPYYDPRLREHTVKGMTTPVLRCVNLFTDVERLVLRFIVNRCRIEKVQQAEVSEQERRLARQIQAFDVYSW